MKSETLNVVAVVLLIFMALFLWGYAGKRGTTASVQGALRSDTLAQSVLTASETFYDFGTISMKNGNVTKEFQVSNPTGSAVEVSTVVTSCMCTKAFLIRPDGSVKGPFGMPGMGYIPPVNEIIPGGESRTIRVVYDPNAHGPAGVGRIDRFITLTDDSGNGLRLEIVANVTP